MCVAPPRADRSAVANRKVIRQFPFTQMSILMHLPGPGFGQAISELGRLLKPAGLLAIGVRGHTSSRVGTTPDPRRW